MSNNNLNFKTINGELYVGDNENKGSGFISKANIQPKLVIPVCGPNNEKVLYIGNEAFREIQEIKEVLIEARLKAINFGAFSCFL